LFVAAGRAVDFMVLAKLKIFRIKLPPGAEGKVHGKFAQEISRPHGRPVFETQEPIPQD
jgi:hypothetical protein